MTNSKMLCIIYFFTTFASSISLNISIHKCSEKQSEALLLFKQDLSSINDTTYRSDCSPIMMNWNTSADCCIWNGVSCDNFTGDVIGLDVSCGMLKGTIHPNTSLFSLPRLQILDLSYNNFSGSQIPREIGMFSNNLTHLSLAGCSFSGQVPSDITLLHKLVSFDLSYNNNGLKLGKDVFINMFQNLTNLEELSLGSVNISSVLPTSLNISSSLKLLSLFNTGMEGKLPHYIFNLHSLEFLDLRGNSFTGDIPSKSSVNLTHLTLLDLTKNKLSGTLPSWLFASPSLEYIFLSDNMFSGIVPFESFAPPSLKMLILSRNLIQEPFPPSICNMGTLWFLDMSNNRFEKGIPETIGNLSSLKVLNLSHNSLDGRIPDSLGKLSEIESLDLSWNQLTGNIPQRLADLTFLAFLNLSRNHLEGRIPDGNQLRTFEENSYYGNPKLCGFPLPRKCNEY